MMELLETDLKHLSQQLWYILSDIATPFSPISNASLVVIGTGHLNRSTLHDEEEFLLHALLYGLG